MSKEPRIFLLGPTASGKTDLTKFCHDEFPINIINVDSAQVYKDFNIGTAKPNEQELAKYPHHLINIINPYTSYSAFDFKDDVERICSTSENKRRIPFLSGGTMMYFNTLEFPLDDIPPTNKNVRCRVANELDAHGLNYLFQKLLELDPVLAKKILPSDTQRILRAVEVFYETGKPLSSFYKTKSRTMNPYPLLKIGLFPEDRDKLHGLIKQRVDSMLSNGLIEEVEKILVLYPDLDDTYMSLRAVGYRQTYLYLKGKLPKEELRDKIVFATRQLAKKQLTWMRKMDNLDTFDPFDNQLRVKVKDKIDSFLGKH